MNKDIPGFLRILLPAMLVPAFGALVGIATSDGVSGWYQTIDQSALTPPDRVFGMVWTGLYILMGIALGLLLNAPDGQPRKKILLGLFLTQLVLNLAWSFIFFQLHLIWLSALWIAVLIGLVLCLMIGLWPLRRAASLLLLPYLSWLCFAFYLSLTIALLN